MADEFLTTKQVVDKYPFFTEGTLRYWRHAGTGPASFTVGGKKVVYRRSEIERWLAEQEAATTRGGGAA
ncbi:helix-turn-helix transcriptional regulator [Gordonia paraffinivorans]|uniref:helix-turn-helix transcriptional regulator n=1 Tax=Gordonia paraffinivorans TaxID=175628 RepID=UPI001445E2C2|nr:helix-turn-helix domain-containing protein [Gordonia paraffinivorans]